MNYDIIIKFKLHIRKIFAEPSQDLRQAFAKRSQNLRKTFATPSQDLRRTFAIHSKRLRKTFAAPSKDIRILSFPDPFELDLSVRMFPSCLVVRMFPFVSLSVLSLSLSSSVSVSVSLFCSVLSVCLSPMGV